MRLSRLLASFLRFCRRLLDVSLPISPRIKATHSAMLAVAVPRNGVPKKITPVVELRRYPYLV